MEKKLTEYDYEVLHYLEKLAKFDRVRLLFFFERTKKILIEDEAMEQAVNIIGKVRKLP